MVVNKAEAGSIADVIEALGEPTMIVDRGAVRIANAAARALFGQAIAGEDVRFVIRHPAALERLLADQAVAPEEIELAGIAGPERRWVMRTAPLEDDSILIRLFDRSEAHAAEQMRVDFVANASHELRTPLATLLGYAETLMDEQVGGDAATRGRFLKIMFDEARRMRQLVDDLISLSRIEAERFSLPRESVALLPLVDEVRGSCGELIAEKGSALRVEGGELKPVVLGDRAQLLQMLRNLVTNALKYGQAGEPVRVRFEAAGPEMLRMSVIDRGDGVRPEHLPRLTERFYRVDPGRSRAMGGTGLGLAIVKHIVGRHRGRLDIRSEVGEGTAVHVYLPFAPAALS
jgi:two-component system, OmpR family, phosphate regulon sensor histidine kinase PhoR